MLPSLTLRTLIGRRACRSGARFVSIEPTPEGLIYGDEHRQLRDTVRKIVDKDINPFVDEWEAARQFPAHKLFKTLGDAGVLGVTMPVEYGGLGLSLSHSVAVHETLGEIECGGVPMAIGVQSSMATPALAMFGSDALRREFLAPTIAGDRVTCLGVSEVSAGSDVAQTTTAAKRDGDDLVINGGKMWTTNGKQADWMCLLANTGDATKGLHRNKSLICVPMNAKGVSTSPKFDKLGMWSSDTCEVFFENVRVPAANVIGEEGMGFTYQMMQFQQERLIAIALCVVTGARGLRPFEKLIERTIEYTRERKIFNKSVLDHQVVHFRLAELKTDVELLRSLLHRAVLTFEAGHDMTMLASMCKLTSGRMAREIPDACLQYWGGMGFMDNYVSRCYRDFRLISIGGGADEVMKAIISKYMRTLPKA